MNVEAEFSRIVESGAWGSPETPCGPGSTLEACQTILESLPGWIRKHGISSIVDLGCGDFHWMKRMDLSRVKYDGYDVVKRLIFENQERYASPNVRFHHADILTVTLPKADLVICKDVLTHLPTGFALTALGSILRSGSRFLAATTAAYWPPENREGMVIGGFSPLDLESEPFLMGKPIEAVEVPMKAGNPRKLFALWNLDEEAVK